MGVKFLSTIGGFILGIIVILTSIVLLVKELINYGIKRTFTSGVTVIGLLCTFIYVSNTFWDFYC